MTEKKYSRAWWLEQLSAEEKAHSSFLKEAETAYKEYRPKDEAVAYPIFWANTQITHSALYSKTPKPDVRKRYQDTQTPREIS